MRKTVNPNDVIGKTINKWHIDSFALTKKWEHYYNCTCECGTKKVVCGRNIITGKSKSCGCQKSKATHDRCFIDVTGQKFNKLTCIKWEKRNNAVYWYCQCDCGNFTWVEASNLKHGEVKSCGCTKEHVNRVHGMSHSRLHRIWSKMQERCFNPNCLSFKYYGQREITVCDEWRGTDGFIRFMNWSLEHGYKDELTIDRINNDGNYEPNNCRWTTQKVQNRNTRVNPHYELNGKMYTIPELAEEFSLPYATVAQRLRKLKWSVEEAIELKPHKRIIKRDEYGRFQAK
jgi:hypothetical protein